MEKHRCLPDRCAPAMWATRRVVTSPSGAPQAVLGDPSTSGKAHLTFSTSLQEARRWPYDRFAVGRTVTLCEHRVIDDQQPGEAG